MKIFKASYLVFYLMLSVYAYADTEYNESSKFDTTQLTEKQLYKVSYSSKLTPIEINKIHAWIIHIEDKNGIDVLNADVEVIGGMPEHNHGLPTQPQITKNLGDGCYLLEGMRFHMLGWWTVTISIQHENINDSATFNLQL